MAVEGNKLITATAHTSQIPPCLFNQHLIASFPLRSHSSTHTRAYLPPSLCCLWSPSLSRILESSFNQDLSRLKVTIATRVFPSSFSQMEAFFPSHSSESWPTHFNPTWAKYNIVTVFESLSSASLGVFAMSLIKTTPDTLQSTPVKQNPVLNHCFRPEGWFNLNTVTLTTPLPNWCVLKALMQITIIIHTSVSF